MARIGTLTLAISKRTSSAAVFAQEFASFYRGHSSGNSGYNHTTTTVATLRALYRSAAAAELAAHMHSGDGWDGKLEQQRTENHKLRAIVVVVETSLLPLQ